VKLPTFFLLTHGAATVTVAVITVGICLTADPLQLVLVSALTVIVTSIAAWRATTTIRTSLKVLDTVVADHEQLETACTGLSEFDRALQILGKNAQRWETAAATTRRQKRELQAMLGLLGGNTTRDPASGQLRSLLAELGSVMHSQHNNIASAAADILGGSEAIAESTETQRHALAEAVACTDRLVTTSDSLRAAISSAVTIGQPSGEWGVQLEELREHAQLLVLNASLQAVHQSESTAKSSDIADEAGALASELHAATDRLVGLIAAADRAHSLCIHQRHETFQHNQQLTQQLQTAVNRCSALTQIQHDHVVGLREASRTLSTHTPIIAHTIDRLRRCRPDAADTIASQRLASVLDGISVGSAELSLQNAGGVA